MEAAAPSSPPRARTALRVWGRPAPPPRPFSASPGRQGPAGTGSRSSCAPPGSWLPISGSLALGTRRLLPAEPPLACGSPQGRERAAGEGPLWGHRAVLASGVGKTRWCFEAGRVPGAWQTRAWPPGVGIAYPKRVWPPDTGMASQRDQEFPTR